MPGRKSRRKPVFSFQHAYHDAASDQIDQAVIVSNDTDLMPALGMIRAHTKVIVGLVIPTLDRQRLPNADLAAHCHWVRRHLTVEELAASQLPRVIHGGKKPTVKPDSWHAHPELFEEALQLATAVRGSRSAAFQWFDAPSPYLGGQTPISLMTTEAGLRQVIAYMRTWTADRSRCLRGPG